MAALVYVLMQAYTSHSDSRYVRVVWCGEVRCGEVRCDEVRCGEVRYGEVW